MKKRAFTIPELLLLVAGVFLLGAWFLPITYQGRAALKPAPNCQTNLSLLRLGMMQYVQDYDEWFPPVKSRAGGWMEVVMPYIRDSQVFQCPKESKGMVRGTTDYFFNARIARQSDARVSFLESVSTTILSGDGASNSPPDFSITRLPKSWAQTQQSPSLRHLNSEDGSYAPDAQHKNGANYIFVNGTVKWLTPEQLTNQNPAVGLATFELP